MNSLEELNAFAQTKIPFVDDRDTNFGSFVNDGLPTTALLAIEDENHSLIFGGSFEGLQALNDETDEYITLEFDFSAAIDPIFNFPPAVRSIQYIELSQGIYQVKFIQTNLDFRNIIDNTTVYLKNQDVNFSYTITASWPGQSHTQTFNVEMTALPETNNLNGFTRNYISGQFNVLFTDNHPTIIDTNPNENYVLQFTVSNGKLKKPGDVYPYADTAVYSGTKETINSALPLLEYIPGLGSSADVTVDYKVTIQKQSGASLDTEIGSFTIAGTRRTTQASWEGLFSDESVVVTEEMVLFSNVDVLAVGAGGGGGALSDRSQLLTSEDGLDGGGGGSGYFIEVMGSNLLQQASPGQTINAIPGTGGLGANWDTATRPTDGSASYITVDSIVKLLAPGGGAGGSSYNSPNSPLGLFIDFNGHAGGMGGGAAGSNENMNQAPVTGALGGAGGQGGIVNQLTGSSILSYGFAGDDANFISGQIFRGAHGGGGRTTGGLNSLPGGTPVTGNMFPGLEFCQKAPPGGRSLTQYYETTQIGSGGKGMGATSLGSPPRAYWNAQNGQPGKVYYRIKQA